jgi:DNA polymerase-3 subunit delta
MEKMMSRLYYFYGRDTFSVQEETSKTLKSFNSEIIPFAGGKDLDLEQLEDTVMQFSMFSEFTVIHISDLNADELPQNRLETLIEILKAVPSTSKIIFSATNFDIYAGGKYISAKNKKILDAVKSNGEIREFNLKTTSEIVKILQKKVKIDTKAAELICEYCLNDTLSCINEAEKLASYAGNREISIADVNLLVSKRLDTNAFALAKSVTNFQNRLAFQLLDDLFNQQTEPIPVWYAVSSSFTDIYRAKIALNSHKNTREIVADFGYKGKDFVVNNAVRSAGNIHISRIRKIMDIISVTDGLLKSSKVDKRIIIEIAIAKMIAV